MAKRETDISLIRKYLNGELDARAMHQLEKRAQADPFLMDAMEGYENSNFNQQANLDELTRRLGERVSKKKMGFIIPFRYMAAAASVLVVLTIGGLWLYNNRQLKNKMVMADLVKPQAKLNTPAPSEISHQKREEIAVLKSPPKPAHQQKAIQIVTEKSSSNAIATAKPPLPNQLANAEFKSKRADSTLKDTTPLNEMIAMDYAKKKEVTATPPVLREVSIPKDKPLQARVNGVQVETRSTSASDLKYNNLLPKNITGRVISNEDRLPLPGASVGIAGTKISAVTDQDGKFTIPADSSKLKLVVAYIGYETAQVNTQGRDSLKTIALQPNKSSLSEVVVAGYGTQMKKSITGEVAHPQNGRPAFDKYLKENATSPDDKTGTVTLSFLVNNNGSTSDFHIIKGLSKGTDQKAIDLIKDGPKWVGNANGKPEKITLKVSFVKE